MALVAFYTRLKNKIQTFNLFEDIEKTEEEDLKNQRISTWIFLILLFLSVFSILAYASLSNVTKTNVIQQPKMTVYKELQSKYPNTLVCPCKQILNEYSTFIVSFTAKFNQICSSDFVNDKWLNYVNYRLLPYMQFHYVFDFRHSAYSFFQMLSTLCILVSQTINDQLIPFYSTTLLTENVVSEETFVAITNASKDLFINTTTSLFQTSLNSLRTIIESNGIGNRLETDAYLSTYQEKDNQWLGTVSNRLYPPDGCSCASYSYCNTTTGIFSVVRKHHSSISIQDYAYMNTIASYRIHLLFHVPGINVGCFILNGVLQSNLSCLYNSSCLSQLNMHLNDSLHPFNATALNVSNSSLLPTVGELVEMLMVDEWLFNSSYDSYFTQCNPSTCTYSYTKQFDILFIITKIMGSIGGIVTILMLVALPLVTLTRRFVYHRRRSLVTQIEIDADNFTSPRQNFQSLPSKIKDFVITLNLYKDPEKQSVDDIRQQRISTRLFIVLMIIALSVLVLYTSLVIVTKTVTIKQPTVNIYTELQTKYSQTIVCPCSQISINYEKFISFHPSFHQICSSDFVTEQWINYFVILNSQNFDVSDFRGIGPIYFSTLIRFCDLSLETINNALLVFNFTKYITKNLQEVNLFRSQTEQITTLFKQTTTSSYLLALSMAQQMTSGNGLLSNVADNYLYSSVGTKSLNQVFVPIIYTSPSSTNGSTNCSCKFYPNTCGQLSGIYALTLPKVDLLFEIPGFWFGCYTIGALYESTFECYFNQSCIDKIYQLTASTSGFPFNATAMIYNSSNTQYEKTAKLQKMIEQLMIEQWNDEILFNSYFEECNPAFCIYTYNTRQDLVDVFTTTIGLIGGLTTILKIIVIPIVAFVAFIVRKKRPQSIQIQVNEHAPSFVRKFIQMLKHYVITFNLFKNRNKRSNEDVQYQRISTRIYIILLIVSLFVLLVYLSLENTTQTKTVKNPSIDQFNLLYQEYSDGVQCPCQKLSIEYQSFIQFYPQFHSVCASDFLTSKIWLEIDYPSSKFDQYGVPTFISNKDDFRQIVSPLVQLLSSFCQLSVQTLNSELLTFNFTTFITPNLVSQQQFDRQTSQIIDQFIENTARSFISTLKLINNMTSASMLISAFSSDSILTRYPQYYYYDYNDYVEDSVYDWTDQQYNSSLTGMSCGCQQNPFCIQQAIVYDLDATTVLFPVPGIYVGCYLVEALLQSDLRCFYDYLCLQQLINSLNLSSNTSTLSNSSSIYEVSTTLQEIISNLMIEQWNNQTFYQDYFNQCQPDECSATYVDQGNVLYIITAMTGLIGGLTKVYTFVIPLLVNVVLRRIIRFKRNRLVNNRVAPLVTTASNTNVLG